MNHTLTKNCHLKDNVVLGNFWRSWLGQGRRQRAEGRSQEEGKSSAMNTVVLNLESIIRLTDEQFYQLCIANKDLSLELNAQGELIIVPPVGGESGNQEAELITDLEIWNRQTKLGKVFSSSTIFRLPNGAKRCLRQAASRLRPMLLG